MPYATARHSLAVVDQPPNCGTAEIDLTGSGFGVCLKEFTPRGCAAWGLLVVPIDASLPNLAGPGKYALLDATPVQPRLTLLGGGFAGRLTPTLDLTHDELAHGADHDHEGRNGGWVLQLHWSTSGAAHAARALDDSRIIVPENPRPHTSLKPLDERGELAHDLRQPVHGWRAVPYVHGGRNVGNDGRPYVAAQLALLQHQG